MAALTSIYRNVEWPHGLMCADCPHVFREGERYAKRLYAFADGIPVVWVLCEPCATAAPGSGPVRLEPPA